jgi:histidinol-phosphate phosphatase family protein
LQAGNADDALLDALHGRDWRTRTGEPRGIFPAHVATVATAGVASVAALAWAALTLRFAWQRIAPGPRTPREIAAMVVTSIAIPFAAVAHRVRGTWRARRERRVGAVLFDRDGTLIADVPALRDPDLVAPLPGAAAALARARRAGLRIGVVSNQPAVGDGRVQPDELVRVHERVRALLGPIDTWSVCTHPAGAGCACRKPQPGGIAAAADALGLAPQRCVMIGDIGSDVDAAQAAGARAILVPTAVTRPEEVTAALSVASDIAIAVDRVVRGRI